MTMKIKPQRTQRAQRGIREYGKRVSVTSVLSVVFEPIPENIKTCMTCFAALILSMEKNSFRIVATATVFEAFMYQVPGLIP